MTKIFPILWKTWQKIYYHWNINKIYQNFIIENIEYNIFQLTVNSIKVLLLNKKLIILMYFDKANKFCLKLYLSYSHHIDIIKECSFLLYENIIK